MNLVPRVLTPWAQVWRPWVRGCKNICFLQKCSKVVLTLPETIKLKRAFVGKLQSSTKAFISSWRRAFVRNDDFCWKRHYWHPPCLELLFSRWTNGFSSQFHLKPPKQFGENRISPRVRRRYRLVWLFKGLCSARLLLHCMWKQAGNIFNCVI